VNAPAALAVLLALSCSVFWSLANVYVRRASLAVGNLRAMFWAQAIGSAVLFPLTCWLEGLPHFPAWTDLAVTAVASCFGYYGMSVAYTRGALTVVVPIVTAWSVPAAVVGVLWSGDMPSQGQWVGGALIVAGALGNSVLASAPGDSSPSGAPVGAMLWAAASAIGFGVMVAGCARMRGDLGAIGVIPAAWMAQWVVLAPLLLIRRDIVSPPPLSALPAVAGMALFEGAGFVCFTFATQLAPVAVVSPPASLSALLTVLYGRVILREPLSPARWGFIALAALGMLLAAGG
jgi:drug/metabolite transporter (DMT)-like permease